MEIDFYDADYNKYTITIRKKNYVVGIGLINHATGLCIIKDIEPEKLFKLLESENNGR